MGAKPILQGIPTDEKRCSVCKVLKPAEEFHYDGFNKDGERKRRADCTACYKGRRKLGKLFTVTPAEITVAEVVQLELIPVLVAREEEEEEDIVPAALTPRPLQATIEYPDDPWTPKEIEGGK